MPCRTTGTTNSNEALYAFDTARRAEHGTVCGVDEAGRGPLCGPACCALAYKIVFISPQEIDERNILWATMDGMAQAVAGLEITPDYVLIDGNRCPPGLIQPAEAVVKGDANSASIAAASILAKVSRDRYMLELDKQYPQYQLARHKGYPTKLHYELIAQYGIQPFYRRSFLKKQGYWHD